MDPTALAAAATVLLAPYVAKAGEKLAEKVCEKLPEQISSLWNAIAAKFKGKPAAEEAAKDLAKAPADDDNQAAFRKELKKLLAEDSDFVRQFLSLLQAAQATHAQIGDQFFGDNAFKVENNYGTIVYGGDNTQNIGVQIKDSTVGGDVTGDDKITSGQ